MRSLLARAARRLRPGTSAGRQATRLSQHIRRLRWQVPLIALLAVLALQTSKHFWFALPANLSFAIELIVYGVAGPVVVWGALGWIQHKAALSEAAEAELVRAHAELTHLNQRVSFLLKVNQRLGEAADEENLAALALQLPGEAVPTVAGCALIRFDEHRQPMPVEYRGALDETALTAWRRHLSSETVRLQCQACQVRTARPGQACAVYEHLPLSNTDRMICLPLERNGRQFAILGLFLAVGQELTEAERDLLEALTAEISIAFENTRLRTQELVTLYDINEALQQRLDFDGLMKSILTRTMEASRADAGLLLLREPDGALKPYAASGEWRGPGPLPLVESLASGALQESSGEPVVAHLQTPDPNTTSVLCAPMLADAGPLGVIVLGSRRREAFVRQHTRLVSAIAGQTALLVENTRLYARLEHQAILAERGRLAREMHDGLAQTLGYLKLRAGQIARWLESGQLERAGSGLRELAQTADEAYLDLRTTLDGLRLPLAAHASPDFAAQLRRLASVFESQSGLAVEMSLEAEPRLSIPAQAHLLRIVQESLANIRKHARADRIRLNMTTMDDRLCVRIQDDGQGFPSAADQPVSRHGLQLMRERAALLGAELSVTSAPGAGTQICVELPLAADRQWQTADGG